MDIMSVYLYKCTSPGRHIVISAKINDDGSLLISEFDGSSSAQDHFSGDQESWLKVNPINIDKLIGIINMENDSLCKKLKSIISQDIQQIKISNRMDLLIWLQQNFNDISAENNLKKLFSALRISYQEGRWP